MAEKTFGDLQIGERFSYRGTAYVKVARAMAQDEKRLGTIFQAGVPVEVEPPKPGQREIPS